MAFSWLFRGAKLQNSCHAGQFSFYTFNNSLRLMDQVNGETNHFLKTRDYYMLWSCFEASHTYHTLSPRICMAYISISKWRTKSPPRESFYCIHSLKLHAESALWSPNRYLQTVASCFSILPTSLFVLRFNISLSQPSSWLSVSWARVGTLGAQR